MIEFTNTRDKIEKLEHWLGWHDEAFNAGIKTIQDAEKLYDYALAHDNLDEFSDTWAKKHHKAAIGYSPWDVARKAAANSE